MKDDRGKARDEKEGVNRSAREGRGKKRRRQYCSNLVIVPAFLNPFKKKGGLQPSLSELTAAE